MPLFGLEAATVQPGASLSLYYLVLPHVGGRRFGDRQSGSDRSPAPIADDGGRSRNFG